MVSVNILWVNGPSSHQRLTLMLEDKTSVLQFKKSVLRTLMEKVNLNSDGIVDEKINSEIRVMIRDGSYLTEREDDLTLGDLCPSPNPSPQNTLSVMASTQYCGLTSISLVHNVIQNPRAKSVPVIPVKFDLAHDSIPTLKKYVIEVGEIDPSQSPYLTLTYGGSELKDSGLPLGTLLDPLHNTIRYYVKNPELPSMDLHIETLGRKVITLKVPPYLSVQGLKLMIREREGLPTDQQGLLFRGHQMEDLNMLAEYGVKNQSRLQLVIKLGGSGGRNVSIAGSIPLHLPRFSFTNIYDGWNMVERKFSPSEQAPFKPWRIVHKGLNFEGICGHSLCRAYKKQVIARWELPNFHLVKDSSKVSCPLCKVTLKSLLTCAFTSTFWRYYGRQSDSQSVVVSGGWEEAKDSYTTFKVKKSKSKSGRGFLGMGNWKLLVIETRARLVDKRGTFLCPTHCGFCFKSLNSSPGSMDESASIRRILCNHVYHVHCTQSPQFQCTMCMCPGP